MPIPDLVVRGGTVVDGTGKGPFTADIAVYDGMIGEIGRITDRARRVIDADGALVVPGAIALLPPVAVADVDRNASHHPAPGVTTTIDVIPSAVADGAAGPAFIRAMSTAEYLTDSAYLADHAALRSTVMGNKVRDHLSPSPGDLEAMGGLLAATLRAGALGVMSRPAGAFNQLSELAAAAARQLSMEPEPQPGFTVLFEPGDDGPDRSLHYGRSLLELQQAPDHVVVISPTALDDGSVATALVATDDNAHLIEQLLIGRSIPGPRLNPLAVIGHRGVATPSVGLARIVNRCASSADVFGLLDRGRLCEESRADINVLDEAHLSVDLSAGVVSTLVAGCEIVNDDELTGESPGRLVRMGGTR